MKVYICFHIYKNQKAIYLIFMDKEKADRFMLKHQDCYLEEWEAVE